MITNESEEVAEPLISSSKPGLDPLRVRVSPAVNAAVIVAHPDDETLWAGGLILAHPDYNWFIATICRKSDPDRSQKFFRVVESYGATGVMADLDDGPEQIPLFSKDIQQTLLQLVPPLAFDLVLTHAPGGEYTRHRRHEEVSRAVMVLWQAGAISSGELRLFAYDDDHGRRLPEAIETAHFYETLPETIRQEKYRLITEVYGFDPESWEARATPHSEAFWGFESPSALQEWLDDLREDQ